MDQDSNDEDVLVRLEAYLSNPLRQFDYSVLQDAYNEIIKLRHPRPEIDIIANLETLPHPYAADAIDYILALIDDRDRWKNNSVTFAVKAHETAKDLIQQRNKIYKIAEMYHLCVEGADQAFKEYSQQEL